MKTKEMTLSEIQDKLGYKIKIVEEKQGIKLGNVPVGKPFKLGKFEFIVLEHSQETSAVILKDFWKKARFDSDFNNYESSDIRNDLNTDFYNQLANAAGKENIVEHTVDLTSDDGRKDYGKCKDNISILTCDLYRRYVHILDNYRPESWWWTATPLSTKANGYSSLVRCVSNHGALYNCDCYFSRGVRPFCILKSNIFVSE